MEKKRKLNLSQIGLYNPQRLNDETIKQLFIVRKALFQELVDKIKKEKSSGIPQHHLIIGQRGMGKTTILKRLEVEFRKNELAGNFIPLLFPEEQYNLKNLAEFWLNSLDALADTLESERMTKEVKQVDEKVAELQQLLKPAQIAKQAYEFLKAFTKTLKRRPILLIDNMSLIFDRLGKEDQHTLRAWLMQNGAPIIIGASYISIEGTSEYGAPFYDAFQMHFLKRLGFEDLLAIITNLAELTQEESVIPELHNRLARLKTLHQLTGGNPRTATMLFRLIIKGFSNDINDDLEALLDEITPLYKARFEELSMQMQVIVDAIALAWDPVNIEQLRKETGYENNQLSPQIKRLLDDGWIEKISTHKGKGFAYQISERFFNIWFLMRRSSRRKKRELYCLSKFLESFYGEEIRSVAQNQLLSKSCNERHLTYNLALAEVVRDEDLKLELSVKSYKDLQSLIQENPEICKNFEVKEVRNKIDPERLWDKLEEYYNSKNYSSAMRITDVLIELYVSNKVISSATHNYRGIIYMDGLQKFPEAEQAFLKSIELNEKNYIAWDDLGSLYQDYMKRYPEAEKAYLKSMDLYEAESTSKFNLVFLYRDKMNMLKEAETVFEQLQPESGLIDSYWLNRALFELYKRNVGIASEHFRSALGTIDEKLPIKTQDDWWRFGAVVCKLGFIEWFRSIMEETGFDTILAPLYVAVVALSQVDTEGYLNSKAVEIREPARIIMEKMKSYNA